MSTNERSRLVMIYGLYILGDITAVQAEAWSGMYLAHLAALTQDPTDGGAW